MCVKLVPAIMGMSYIIQDTYVIMGQQPPFRRWQRVKIVRDIDCVYHLMRRC